MDRLFHWIRQTYAAKAPAQRHLTPDRAQGIRLFGHLLGVTSSVVVVAVAYLHAADGRMPLGVAHQFAVLVALTAAAFTLSFATGFNRRFTDPGLTVAQMATSGAVIGYLVWAAPDMRPFVPPFYMLVLAFGAFRLKTHQQLAISAYFVLTYALPAAAAGAAPVQAWAVPALTLALLLLGMSLVGGYVNNIRSRLRSTNAELGRALQKIERIATYDDLTGLYNRRVIHETATREQKRADRSGASLCVAMLDVDHFKRFNDQYGHVVGDQVLRMLSRILQSTLRDTEHVGRYGGEEFLIVLPDTTAQLATMPVERLRAAVASARIEGLPPEVRVTVSVGIAQYRRGEGIVATIGRADAALYEAKRQGRNRAVCREP
ncbi:MAG: GGDEF domain-containing protein [Pseudomonadota bacterium]